MGWLAAGEVVASPPIGHVAWGWVRRHLRQSAITASPAPSDDIAPANPVGTIAVWVRTATGAPRPIPQADDRRRVAFPCHAVLSYGIDCSRA